MSGFLISPSPLFRYLEFCRNLTKRKKNTHADRIVNILSDIYIKKCNYIKYLIDYQGDSHGSC